MRITQKPSKPKQQVCEETQDALYDADDAISQACRALDAAANQMMRNGDGDLRAVEDALAMLMQARTTLNA